MTFFDYLNNILFFKSQDQYEKHVNDVDFESTFSSYMILRFLTMTKSTNVNAFIATRIIILEKLSQKALYQFLLKTIPKMPFYRIQYIK